MQTPMIEKNCMEGLHWRWTIPPDITLPLLKDGLRQRGYKDESQFDWVWELVHENEHKIVIVPKTRRLQIRIHYLIPRDKRATAAWSIALHIHESCESIHECERAEA